jgi:hypothetical protein
MAIDEGPPQSRRRLLITGAGGLAALAAGMLGRSSPARATDGETVLVGHEYTATTRTRWINDTNDAVLIWGETSTGTGILGTAKTTGTGVYGESVSSYGVHGHSPHIGVYGSTAATFGVGVRGDATQGGIGVVGTTDAGHAMYALSGPNGTALTVEGRAIFTRSGLADIPVSSRSGTVTPGFDLTVNSRILCTLDSNQSGLFLHRVAMNITANTFKIVLSASVATGRYAKVAWIIFG